MTDQNKIPTKADVLAALVDGQVTVTEEQFEAFLAHDRAEAAASALEAFAKTQASSLVIRAAREEAARLRAEA